MASPIRTYLYYYFCTIFSEELQGDANIAASKQAFFHYFSNLAYSSRGVMTVIKRAIESKYHIRVSYRTWYRWLKEFPELRKIIQYAREEGLPPTHIGQNLNQESGRT